MRAVVTTSYPAQADDADGHFVRTEALAHARRGEAVTVLTPQRVSRVLDDAAKVRELPGGDAFGSPGLVARLRADPRRALGAARFFVETRRALEDLRPDSLEVHWPFPTALAIPRSLHGVPTTLVSHGACVRALLALPASLRERTVRNLLRPGVRWRFVSETLRASLVAVLSPELAERLTDASFVEAAAIALPPRSKLAPPWPRPAFVVLGRLVASKGVDDCLTYAAQHEHIRTHDVVLIGDGPLRASLVARGRALGLRLHSLGQLPRARALGILAGSRGLLFGSQAEGLSTVLREADHYGVPVVRVR